MLSDRVSWIARARAVERTCEWCGERHCDCARLERVVVAVTLACLLLACALCW